jgi:hypothetical protein
MRVKIYTLAIVLSAGMAFAQDTPPAQPQQPKEPATATKAANKAKDADKTAGQAATARAEEMKTQNYSGTLTDATCAGSSSTASADRAAGSAASPSCTVSASTTQFALTMKDGKVVKFDDVGNLRAQEAFKSHKKWNDAATAGKPVRVKTGGILNGDLITVTSIN